MYQPDFKIIIHDSGEGVLHTTREQLREFIAVSHLNDDQSFALITAIGEATINAIEHAYGFLGGKIIITINFNTKILHASVEDFGSWKHYVLPVKETLLHRGRGLILIGALMSRYSLVSKKENGTIIHMELDIA